MKIKGIKGTSIIILIILSIFGVTALVGCTQNEVNVIKEESISSRTITDMAGRKVEVPSEIKKIYSINPMGTILTYTIAPDTLLGWNRKINNDSLEFIPEKYRELPVLGNINGQSSAPNVEEIISLKPDLVILMKNSIDENVKNQAEKVTEQLETPVVIIENNLDKTAEMYRFMGDLIGREEQAEKLIAYYEKTMKTIGKGKKFLGEREKVRVYYGSGEDGLSTGNKNSPHAQLIELVGGINVADTVDNVKRFRTSIEQVMLWNPEIIIITEKNENESMLYEKILDSEEWKNTTAVKNKNVYKSPTNYFDWFDRPPTVNRILGINWLANLLYPNAYNIDIEKEVKEFYSLFYHIDLSDKQVKRLLKK
jgi:iron complex transport system substrate-binding protein